MALNPFVWNRPLDDPTKIVGMDDFAREVALTLKAQTNVAIFGARNTGKSTFLTVLGRELAAEQEPDAPPHAMIRIDLKRALSIPAFVACVDDALREHPEHAIRRAAARELEVLEREIGFDLKIVRGATRVGHGRPAARAAALPDPRREPRRGLLRRVPAAQPLPRRAAGGHRLGAPGRGRR